MSKRIVLCTDGTWDNTSSQTNVYRVFKALTVSAGQVGFYDDGVGADGLPIDRLAGGALGLGLFNKIKQGYTQIAHVYETADDIFLFGFSRGAYTARSIAGMIAICGLPTKNFDDNLVETAFQAYRQKDQRATLLAELNKKYDMYDAKLTMVGVWETVGALGIPAIFGGVDLLHYGFLDTSLHADVLNAYHALAIDERRAEFLPRPQLAARPIAGRIGAEIEGISLSGDLPKEALTAINGALLRFRVIFFRNQNHLSDEEQERFSSQFGELVNHPPVPVRSGTRSILELDSTKGGGRANQWHTDVTFVDAYPKISILRGVRVPDYGGDTVWANTMAAYQDLPPQLKDLAEKLWAVHSNGYDYAAVRPASTPEDRRHYEEVFTSTIYETEHPVVRIHPETGERSLVLGYFVQKFVGFSQSASNHLFELLHMPAG
jgi:alpha-ketoglutarate-dependent sulfate ester dioxygenase